jgi:hypothetical protein
MKTYDRASTFFRLKDARLESLNPLSAQNTAGKKENRDGQATQRSFIRPSPKTDELRLNLFFA